VASSLLRTILRRTDSGFEQAILGQVLSEKQEHQDHGQVSSIA
jgi:hypothetical protein